MSNFKGGRVHFRNSGMKLLTSPLSTCTTGKKCNSNVARPVHGGMHAHAIPSLLPHPEGKVVRGGNQGVRFNNEDGTLHC